MDEANYPGDKVQVLELQNRICFFFVLIILVNWEFQHGYGESAVGAVNRWLSSTVCLSEYRKVSRKL